MKVALDGGSPARVGTLPATRFAVAGIALQSGAIFWTVSNELDGTVMKADLDGGAPVTLASGQNTPMGIVASQRSVFWVDYASSGAVMKVTPE